MNAASRFISSFFRRPVPVGRAALPAGALGLLAPSLQYFLMTFAVRMALEARIWSFFIVLMATVLLVGRLYRLVGRAGFRTVKETPVVTAVSLVLLAAGAYGSFWCFGNHVSWGGHMDYPLYPAFHYLADAGWAACLALSAVVLTRARSSLSLAVTTAAAYAICFRFIYGSLGGAIPNIPL
jgi:hypothetical protein